MKEVSANFNIKGLVAQILGLFIAFALALFLPAGTFRWVAGWCFLILFFGFVVIISLWLLKHDPGLLQERMTGLRRPNQKRWISAHEPGLDFLYCMDGPNASRCC